MRLRRRRLKTRLICSADADTAALCSDVAQHSHILCFWKFSDVRCVWGSTSGRTGLNDPLTTRGRQIQQASSNYGGCQGTKWTFPGLLLLEFPIRPIPTSLEYWNIDARVSFVFSRLLMVCFVCFRAAGFRQPASGSAGILDGLCQKTRRKLSCKVSQTQTASGKIRTPSRQNKPKQNITSSSHNTRKRQWLSK